jgi:RNA polymerase sigma-70 factor (ECF subfamily)
MMERLSPPERAVFVLREAFELPYDEIAGIVGVSVANARQLHHRASVRLAEGRDRFRPSSEEHAELLTTFMRAAVGGDLAALTELLHEDVVAYNDGGGKVRAALRPILGRDKVSSFLLGLVARYDFKEVRMMEVNGLPAVATQVGGHRQLVMIGIRDGRISEIYGVLNPDKLAHVPLT